MNPAWNRDLGNVTNETFRNQPARSLVKYVIRVRFEIDGNLPPPIQQRNRSSLTIVRRMPDKAHKKFAKLLRHHSHGFALYHPVPAIEMKVGSLGMFDDNGHWFEIYPDIRSASLSRPYGGPLIPLERGAGRSGVFSSTSIKSLDVGLGASVE